MQEKIAGQLLAINEQFYNTIAEEFSATRKNVQPGWDKLWKYIIPQPEAILDVGCGNGRFAGFIQTAYAKSPGKHFTYKGIDGNKMLLEIAGKKYPGKNFVFARQKIMNATLSGKSLELNGSYDLIAGFALLHHLPGYANRIGLLKELTTFLKSGGFLAISLWRFMQDKKLSSKVISLEKAGLTSNDVEKNDYLLSWGSQKTDSVNAGTSIMRYCHYFDDSEIILMCQSLPLKLIKKFTEDGKSRNLNYYLLFQKE